MKRVVIASLFCASAILAFAQSRSGSILVQVGGGIGMPMAAGIVLSPSVVWDAEAGIAIYDKLYAIAVIDSANEMTLPNEPPSDTKFTVGSFAAGLRFYPSITGFYAGVQAGAGGVRSSHIFEDPDISFPHFTVGAFAGYDFSRKPRGFSVALEAKLFTIFINGTTAGAATLTANVCYK